MNDYMLRLKSGRVVKSKWFYFVSKDSYGIGTIQGMSVAVDNFLQNPNGGIYCSDSDDDFGKPNGEFIPTCNIESIVPKSGR